MRPILILVWAAALQLGCAEAVSPRVPEHKGPKEDTDTDLGFSEERGDRLPDFAHPEPIVPPAARNPGRLTVHQLAGIVGGLAGNDSEGNPIQWTAEVNGRTVNAFGYSAYGKALGRTDNFGEITEPNLSMSPLYLKFVEDMARQVCDKMAAADAERDIEDRTLLRFAPHAGEGTANTEQINRNLRYLALKFLGVKTDDAGIEDLKQVYTEAAAHSDQVFGWKTVCVALFLTPSFHVY